MNLKTILGWLALTFVLWFVIVDEPAAAHVVQNIGTFLQESARGIAVFFSQI